MKKTNFLNTQIFKKIVIVMFVVMLVLPGILSNVVTANAATVPNLRGQKIKGYPYTDKNFSVYNGTGTSKSKIGTCYGASDEITIHEIYSNGWCRITYPVGKNRTKTGYCETKFIFQNPNFSAKTGKAQAKITTYTKLNCAKKYGSISKNDAVYIVSSRNDNTQVIYPCSGYYKVAWVKGVYKISNGKLVKSTSTNRDTAVNTSSAWQWPVSKAYVCGNDWSEYYGAKKGDHLGVDIKSRTGDTNIYAAASGKVVYVGYNKSNGNSIVIQHNVNGKTVYSFYGHLKRYNVSKNTQVSKGQKIGILGNSGSSSTGAHLHFGITTQKSLGTWGYGSSFSNSANSVSRHGYTYYNPHYVVKYSKLP